MTQKFCIGKLKSYEAFEVEWIFYDLLSKSDTRIRSSPVFTFAKNTWALELFVEPIFGSLNMYVGLINVRGTWEWPENFKCRFGLKDVDGTVFHFSPCSTKRFGVDAIAAKQLLPFEYVNLSPRYKFIISCTLLKDPIHNVLPSASHELETLQLISTYPNSDLFGSLPSTEMSKRICIGKPKCSEAFEVEWIFSDLLSKSDTRIRSSSVFTFAENRWALKLSAQPTLDSLNVNVGLVKVKGIREWREKFKCIFRLKNVDGTVSHFNPCSTKEFGVDSIAAKQQLRWECDSLSSDKFIIVCTLSKDPNHIAQSSASLELAPLKLKKLNTLSENFKSLFADKDSCDVILRVKNKEFKAHKAVLMARSTVFSAIFHHNSLGNQTSIVPITNCDPDSFHLFLEYLYSGKLDGFSFQNIFHLYCTSDKYNIQELKAFCAKYMERNLTENNACDVIMLADMYDEAALLSAAQDFFNKNSIKIVETIHWEGLMKYNYRLANKVIKAAFKDSDSSK